MLVQIFASLIAFIMLAAGFSFFADARTFTAGAVFCVGSMLLFAAIGIYGELQTIRNLLQKERRPDEKTETAARRPMSPPKATPLC